MNETQTTVRGTIITDPFTRRVGDDEVFTFRVASNTRYLDRASGEWRTGGTLYFSANCWGKLAQRTAGRLFKGDGVLVHGRLLTNEYERDGRIQRDLEMRVSAIGPDMSRMEVSAKRLRFDPRDPAAGAGGETQGEGGSGGPMTVGSVEAGADGPDHGAADEVDIDEAAEALKAMDEAELDGEDSVSDTGRYAGVATS